MTTLKQIAKNLAGEMLLRTGVWRRHLEKMARRGEAIILIYHRLIEKWDRTLDYSQPGMVVTTDTFDRQLQFFKKHFEIVSLSSLVNSQFAIRNSQCSDFRDGQSAIRHPSLANSKSEFRNPKPRCVITFDDGWRDNYDIAFPILRKHGVPATIFLTTDFIGANRAFWHTELLYLLMHGDLSVLTRDKAVLETYPLPVRSRLNNITRMRRPPNAQDVDPLIEVVKEACDEQTIQDLIRSLANILGICVPLFVDTGFFLDWSQVREMASAGIEIGSHGCSHMILTRLDSQEAEQELLRSKTEIESHIDQRVQHFAFPDGAANRHLIEAVRRAGYNSACVLATGPNERRSEFPVLRRVGMHEGASEGGNGAFSETSLLSWLLRAPRTGPVSLMQ